MKKFLVFSSIILLLTASCNHNKKEAIFFHKFEKKSWYRYDHLTFNIPIQEVNMPYTLYFFAKHGKNYEFDNLDFGIIMNTPSGEERINQYNFVIRNKFGGFTGTCIQDTCEAIIPIKRGIIFSQKGILKLDVENLVPRLEVKDLFGVGIKLVPGS